MIILGWRLGVPPFKETGPIWWNNWIFGYQTHRDLVISYGNPCLVERIAQVGVLPRTRPGRCTMHKTIKTIVDGAHSHLGVSKIVGPQNGWFIMENLIKLDDLGGTTIFGNIHLCLGKSRVLLPWMGNRWIWCAGQMNHRSWCKNMIIWLCCVSSGWTIFFPTFKWLTLDEWSWKYMEIWIDW